MNRRYAHKAGRVVLAVWLVGLAVLAAGCDGDRIDASKLYKGMDRSTIIATFGPPDSRKQHDLAERLSYRDGEHYQYLLMLIDGRLAYWDHDRVYKASRFSNIRGTSQAVK